MENTIQFITELDRFINLALTMLESIDDSEILIAGTFNSFAYRDILNRIITMHNLNKCKMIIPYISKNGIISRNYTNIIINKGGQVRLNSKFNNNLIIIGNHAFVITFNQKYNSGYGMKNSFESCILMNYDNPVNDIKKVFMNNWHNSLPLNNV